MAKEIRIGSLVFQEGTNLENITYHAACNLAGEELSEDTIDVSVFYNDVDNILRSMPDNTPIYYYNDGALVTKLYKSKLERTASAKYTISGTSIVGLLNNEMFYGGMYSGQTLSSVVESIMLTDGLHSDNYNRYVRVKAIETIPYSGNGYSMGTSLIDNWLEGNTTIRCRMMAKFRIVTLHPAWSGGGAKISILYGLTGSIDYNKPEYGITYYSSATGSLFLHFVTTDFSSQKRFPNSTLHDGDIVELDINPVAGYAKATINGVATTLDISSTHETHQYEINGKTNLYLYGGGVGTYSSGVANYIDMEYDYYKVYDQNGNLVIDAMAYSDTTDGTLYIKNTVDGYTTTAVASAASKYGAYSGSETGFVKVSEAMANLINDIQYESGIQSTRVFGWIKTGRKREAFYQLLFSQSLNLLHTADGGVKITGLSSGKVADLDDEKIYERGSERQFDSIRTISLTEHAYSALADSEIVFDNSDIVAPSGTYIAEFDKAPIYGTPTASSGLTIVAYNCNCAVVSGKGIITARPYLHSTSVISKQISDDLNGKDISVSGATMVTFVNSAVVFARLEAYYNPSLSLIKNSIVASGEKCGSKYGFTGPFGDATEAFLQKIDATPSAITKFDCEFVKGYVPPKKTGGDYDDYVILTRSGRWTVPSGVTKIRVVLIGGGTGGSSGLDGEDGAELLVKTDEQLSGIRAAKGGAPGTAGESGKIYEVEITSPASYYDFIIGAGGNGGYSHGQEEHGIGDPGGDTTFGSYSSASGVVRPTGISNIFTGEIYANATPNYSGQQGYGADGGYPSYDSTTHQVVYHNGGDAVNPFTGEVHRGGTNGTGFSQPAWGYDFVSGGFGAGASCSYDGKDGSNSEARTETGGSTVISFGYGGTSWSPYMTQNAPSGYGRGGYGGFGGPGGGASYYMQGSGYAERGRNGKGARGANGGNGNPGCILVYYKKAVV